MTDTPKHIKELQEQLWRNKTPEQRLLQFIQENEAWLKAIKATKEAILQQKKQRIAGN